MRFIDLTTFLPLNSWIDIANQHTAIITPLTRSQRSDYFKVPENKYWNESIFLDSLKEHGKRKCWYSETRNKVQLFVDHFRPKLMVTKITGSYVYREAGTRPLPLGYYWLAYDFQNYRIANNISNGRKGGYLPLETHSVSVESYPIGDVSPEINMLLDPCVQDDVNLLMYNIIKAKPSYTKAENEHNFHRAEISIMAFNLDDSFLQTLRKKTLKMCNNLYIEANNAYLQNNHEKFSNNCSKLVDMLSPEAEFTMMIKHRLIGLDEEWLETYVLDNARELNYIN